MKQATKCETHGKAVVSLCLSQNCNSRFCYICPEEECQKRHDHPKRQQITVARMNDLISDSYYSLNHLMPKIAKYFKTVREEIMNQLHKDQDVLTYLIERMEYCDTQSVWQTLKTFQKGQFYKLTPEKLRDLVQDLLSEDRKQTVKDRAAIYQKQIEMMKERVSELLKCEQYKDLTLAKRFMNPKKHIEFQSAIVQGQKQLELSKLLRKAGLPLVNTTLLYRGSQNAYSIEKLHNKINGISPLLVLVKAVTGNIFGSYLNCKIIDTNDWIADPSKKSFLFSLTKQSIHKIKDDDSKLKTVFGSRQGIKVGSGCDLYIGEACDMNFVSGSRLGGTFQLPDGMKFRTVEADSHLAGSQKFLVLDYEVFKFS